MYTSILPGIKGFDGAMGGGAMGGGAMGGGVMRGGAMRGRTVKQTNLLALFTRPVESKAATARLASAEPISVLHHWACLISAMSICRGDGSHVSPIKVVRLKHTG